jgi:hypothetical protein
MVLFSHCAAKKQIQHLAHETCCQWSVFMQEKRALAPEHARNCVVTHLRPSRGSSPNQGSWVMPDSSQTSKSARTTACRLFEGP